MPKAHISPPTTLKNRTVILHQDGKGHFAIPISLIDQIEFRTPIDVNVCVASNGATTFRGFSKEPVDFTQGRDLVKMFNKAQSINRAITDLKYREEITSRREEIIRNYKMKRGVYTNQCAETIRNLLNWKERNSHDGIPGLDNVLNYGILHIIERNDIGFSPNRPKGIFISVWKRLIKGRGSKPVGESLRGLKISTKELCQETLEVNKLFLVEMFPLINYLLQEKTRYEPFDLPIFSRSIKNLPIYTGVGTTRLHNLVDDYYVFLNGKIPFGSKKVLEKPSCLNPFPWAKPVLIETVVNHVLYNIERVDEVKCEINLTLNMPKITPAYPVDLDLLRDARKVFGEFPSLQEYLIGVLSTIPRKFQGYLVKQIYSKIQGRFLRSSELRLRYRNLLFNTLSMDESDNNFEDLFDLSKSLTGD